MTRNEILTRLRTHEAELRQAGVLSLSLFGSAARDEADENSDVDLLVRLDERPGQGGFGHFGRIDALQKRLSAILGRPVDLIAEPMRRPRLRQSVERDRVRAF